MPVEMSSAVGVRLSVFPAEVVAGDRVRDRGRLRTVARIEYVGYLDDPVYEFHFAPLAGPEREGGAPLGEADSLDYSASIALTVWREER